MSELFLDATGLTMPATETIIRIRAGTKPDPYNPSASAADWEHTDRIELQGFISSSSSTQTSGRLDTTVESTAVLTCPDPDTDIRVGDIIHPKADQSRQWRVTGIPSTDMNPFTGWRPTIEAQLREVKG